MSSIAEAIAAAAPPFTGQLLRPTDHGYDDIRRVHNGLIDRRPAAIARCHGVADLVDAVQLAARSASRSRYAAEVTMSRAGRRSTTV